MLSLLKSKIPSIRGNQLHKLLFFHSLSAQIPVVTRHFLIPNLQTVIQNCGLKIKGIVKRRCKDCYMVMREGRLYNMCKTHGRHKQAAMAKKPINTWILSHATQSKVRPW